MINAKNILSVFCSSLLVASMFAGCAKSESASANMSRGVPGDISISEQSPATSQMPAIKSAKAMIRIGAMQDASGLGLVKLMEDNSQKATENVYEFTISTDTDEIIDKILNGELDIASVPTDLAGALYSKTEGNIKIISVNTLGFLYLMKSADADNIKDISDLEGKEIISAGKGTPQEYILTYLLDKNDLGADDDITVTYRTDNSEAAALILDGKADYALLPQPFASSVIVKDDTKKIVLDINKEWKTATGQELPMNCIVVRSEFLEKNSSAVELFLSEYSSSVEYVNSNIKEAAEFSGRFEIITEAVAEKAITKSNIVCLTGEQMKEPVTAYLDILFSANSKLIGDALPDDSFYYIP